MNTELLAMQEITDLVIYKRIKSCDSAIKQRTTVLNIKREYLEKLHSFNQNCYSEYTKECNMLQQEIAQLEFEIGTFASRKEQLQRQLKL